MQVELSPKRERQLESMARERGVSVDEVLDELLGKLLDTHENDVESDSERGTRIRRLRERLYAKTDDELLDQMTPENRALHEKIMANRFRAAAGFDVVEALREMRKDG